jgi:multisubunit Na+/H+ antiporter MnhG subunit
VLFFSITGVGFAGRAFLVFLFLYFTSALGTHMISKSFYHRYLEDVPLNSTSVVDPVECSKPTKEG